MNKGLNTKQRLDANKKVLPDYVCKVCGYKFDAATCCRDREARPKPFDIILCMKCGEMYHFDEQMKVVEPSIEYLNAIPPEVMREIDHLQKTIRQMRVLG